jgi:hypothetical protein
MVGIAYGGSNRPNRPQALHGYAHELTCFGAARIGSQCGSMLAIPEGSAVLGQSVPKSLRVSWRVNVPLTIVDTSPKSSGSIQFVAEGLTIPRELVPTAVGINMYTEGEVLISPLLLGGSSWLRHIGSGLESHSQGVVECSIYVSGRVRIRPINWPEK